MALLSDMTPPVRPAGLMERWYRFRDATMRRPEFQRWAARFPLTRPIARQRQRDLFDLVSGFVYSQILSACVRLKLFDVLADGPQTLDEIAPRIGLKREAAQRLLAAAAALRLASERGNGHYGLGDLGAALLGNPGVVAMIEHHAILYDDLRDPVALLRGEIAEPKLSRYWAYASTRAPGDLDAGKVGDYSRLMAVSQDFIANDVLDAFPMAAYRRLVDVGGGEGAFLTVAARRTPELKVTLFDLPAVAARAETRFRAAGLGDRAMAVGGDLFRDSLPAGADLYSLVRVLYDHPRPRALAILKSVRAAIAPGGTLLVAEPMAGTKGAEAVGAAYFGFYLLAMKGGDSRTPNDLIALIREAGFASAEIVPTASPLLVGLIRARA